MKTVYQLIKAVDGQPRHQAQEICTYDADEIEIARRDLAEQMKYIAERNDYYEFISSKEAAENEISFVEEARVDKGDEYVDGIVKTIREGMEEGYPFLYSATNGETINIIDDSFHFDNYRISIEAEKESSCDPFEAGTSYPVLIQDEQGNNKQVDYVNGADLLDYDYLANFADMDQDFKSQVLTNLEEGDDIEATKAGQVWVNANRTVYAVLYGD